MYISDPANLPPDSGRCEFHEQIYGNDAHNTISISYILVYRNYDDIPYLIYFVQANIIDFFSLGNMQNLQMEVAKFCIYASYVFYEVSLENILYLNWNEDTYIFI